jgi:hypothetical protein
MSKLRKLRALSWGDCKALARAFALLPLLEIGLRVLPFRALLRWVQTTGSAVGDGGAPDPERTAWLVDVAARYSLLRRPPQSTCLRRALALCALLSRQGRNPRLVIGTDTSRQDFRAHAWVDLDGTILGREDASGYDELARFEGAAVQRQTA